jgi:hypothetical protein
LKPAARVPRRFLVELVLLHATVAGGYVVLLARELWERARIVSTDFTVFFTGWSLVAGRQAAHLYDSAAQAAAQERIMAPLQFPGGLMAFVNPPHVALAFAPLAWLDLANAFRLWTAVQLVLAVLLVRDVLALVRPRGAPALERWVVATAIAAFWPLFYAVEIGQLSVLLALALLRLRAALAANAAARAGAWLFVLGVKPQLLPLLVALLAAYGCWRALGWAALFAGAAVAATGGALGWRVWRDWLANLGHLESFFAQGTPDHMTNLRGVVALLTGTAGPSLAASTIVLALAAVVVLVVATRARRPGSLETAGRRPHGRAFALTVGASLLVSPHLFLQDVTSWIVPVAVFYAALGGDRGEEAPPAARAFGRFALAWPLFFVGVGAYGALTGRSPAALALVPLVTAFGWMAIIHAAPTAPATTSR